MIYIYCVSISPAVRSSSSLPRWRSPPMGYVRMILSYLLDGESEILYIQPLCKFDSSTSFHPCHASQNGIFPRIACNLQVRCPQAQAWPAEERQPQGVSNGGRVAGGGGQPVHRCTEPYPVPVPRQPYVRGHHWPEGGGGEPGEAEEGAGGVRGAPGQAQVPRRRLPQPRRPQPRLRHALPARDAPCFSVRPVPARQGMVGWPHGQAVCPEGRRAHEAVCLKWAVFVRSWNNNIYKPTIELCPGSRSIGMLSSRLLCWIS